MVLAVSLRDPAGEYESIGLLLFQHTGREQLAVCGQILQRSSEWRIDNHRRPVELRRKRRALALDDRYNIVKCHGCKHKIS